MSPKQEPKQTDNYNYQDPYSLLSDIKPQVKEEAKGKLVYVVSCVFSLCADSNVSLSYEWLYVH